MDDTLCLAPITLQAFTRGEATALSGVGLLFGVSYAGDIACSFRSCCLQGTARRKRCPLRR